MLVGGRCTVEDAYAYAKLARVALGTNDVDFRARPHSAEEASFLAAHVAGSGLGTTYDELERASSVLLVGLEPEDESPILFLRLRKATRKGLAVHAVAPLASRGLQKLAGTLLATTPGAEPDMLDALRTRHDSVADAADAVHGAGSIVLVGERLASVPGALSAVAALAAATGARLAWVPRRAGERGALEAGALPNLLPGGRPVADAGGQGRRGHRLGGRPPSGGRRSRHRGYARCCPHRRGPRACRRRCGPARPARPARGARRDRRGAVRRQPGAARVGGRTERADVVLPVAAAVEKAGSYVDWEGRSRPFEPVLRGTNAMPDVRVLHVLAEAMGVALALPDVAAARAEIQELGRWDGAGAALTPVPAAAAVSPAAGRAVLATWAQLLDARPAAGRRALPRGHGTRSRGTAVSRHRGRTGRERRRGGHRQHRRGCPDGSRRWSPRCPTASCGSRPTRVACAVRRALGAAHGAVVGLARAAASVEQEERR